MPVYLRRFYTEKLIEEKEKEQKEVEKVKSNSKKPKDPRIRY